MIFKIWETIIGYVREKPYWSKIQPFCVLFSLYIMTGVLGYQYIQWQYQFSPALSLYLNSYIFKQITIVFIAIGIVGIILSVFGKHREREKQNRLGDILRKYTRVTLRRLLILGSALIVIALIFVYFSPHRVSHIRLKFLREPDFDKYAFVYLIYELNRLQKNWYFEVDFKVFNVNALTSEERKRCGDEGDRSLCYAEMISNGKPFIGITTEQLGEDFFWQNRNRVSVVSTFGWDDFAPPSVYEYLTYSIIVQSMVIHLNAHCKGLPKDAFKESRISHGDLFQFSPDRREIKAAILASHLNKQGEELLFNCFGAEYTSICSNLLTLEWLRSKRVTENLEKCFRVKF